jgi:HAD superfamily phosphatase (TIGR01668 family)
MYKKFIPTMYEKSIYEIDFKALYDKGIRLILSDLDNTLIPYDEKDPREETYALINKIKELGFEFIIVSNSKKDRASNFAQKIDVPCVKFATKPLKRGIKKAIKKVAKNKYNNNEIILFGDQVMTDIMGANRSKINSCLIKPIKRESEHFPTSFNRKIERFFLKRIKKKKNDIYNIYFKEFNSYE